MGHTRLGSIPKTREWQEVVAAVTGSQVGGHGSAGASVPDIALVSAKTLKAAEAGIAQAKQDRGLGFTFYLLTQIALASRTSDWLAQLGEVGLELRPESSLFDLTLQMQKRVDEYLRGQGPSSDLSEMAQRAAGEALSALARDRSETLFGNSGEELQHAVRVLSTKRGFADLGQSFFARFMSQFLSFYLSRIAANQVGRGPLSTIADVSRFNHELALHCQESARIVRDFCGEWYSKTEFTEGIGLDNTSRFVAVAIDKLQAELRKQRDRHD